MTLSPKDHSMMFRKFAAMAALLLPLLAGAATVARDSLPVAAPALSFSDMQGPSYTLDSLKGQVVVMSYWFTDCAPCVQEVPILNQIVDKFAGKKVLFLAPAYDSKEKVAAFLKTHPLKYKTIFTADDKLSDIFPNGNIMFPLHVIVGKDGKIVYRKPGTADLKEISLAIESALAQGGGR